MKFNTPLGRMKFKIPAEWNIIKEFEYESSLVQGQVHKCIYSNIRSDILMLIIQYKEDKFLDTINWINLVRGNGKTETCYNLFKFVMKRKYDIEMPEWDE
jgi:hypothetical protein